MPEGWTSGFPTCPTRSREEQRYYAVKSLLLYRWKPSPWEAWGMNERQNSLKTFYSEQKASDDIWQKDISKEPPTRNSNSISDSSAQLILKDWFMYQSIPVWLNHHTLLGIQPWHCPPSYLHLPPRNQHILCGINCHSKLNSGKSCLCANSFTNWLQDSLNMPVAVVSFPVTTPNVNFFPQGWSS